MGSLLVLMLVKKHYNQNTFTGLGYSSFTIFDQKFWNGIPVYKDFKKTHRFRTNTPGFAVISLSYCTMMLGNSFEKEKIHKVIIECRKYVTM